MDPQVMQSIMQMLQNGIPNFSGGMGISGYSEDPTNEISNQLQIGQPLNYQSEFSPQGQNMGMGAGQNQQQFSPMNLSSMSGFRNNVAQNARSNMNHNPSSQGWSSFMGNDPSAIMNNLMMG